MSSGLQLQNVHKRYDGRAVLEAVSMTVQAGQVRALVGENGAGKSTLVKVACGLVAPEEGTVSIDGAVLRVGDAAAAASRGVGVMHQHFMLVPTLTVTENVVLGREPRRGFLGLFVDREAARKEVQALSEQYALPVDPDALVGSLAVGERQRVELLKVLYRGAKYVLLDEPTAVLSPGEVQGFLSMVRGLASGGAGVLLISHKMEEVLALASELTVLRRGKVVLERSCEGLTIDEVARAIVGGETPEKVERKATAASSKAVLAAEGLQGDGLHGVSFTLRQGEVLGVAGVEGNGQRPLAEMLAGIRIPKAGNVQLLGEDVTAVSVLERRKRGMGYVPEDREGSGLCGALSIAENLALGVPEAIEGTKWRTKDAQASDAAAVVKAYDVRPADPTLAVEALSGGNAQKVLVARELTRSLQVLVLAQPTRGVDLGAAAVLRKHIATATEAGVGVLLLSSELEELRALSDRIMVLRAGKVVGEMPAKEATDEVLGRLMVGTEARAQ